MKEWGFPVSIKDILEIDGTEDFIYNRYTDFTCGKKNQSV